MGKMVDQESFCIVQLDGQCGRNGSIFLQNRDNEVEVFPEIDSLLEEIIKLSLFNVELLIDAALEPTFIRSVQRIPQKCAPQNKPNDRRVLLVES